MTHTSMDVGNIISIIIPESPDTTINVDQLTADFRRQLERIHKQSRVNKLEHGLVTLKNVLPEMSREEKKKSLPLIRRVLQTRRILSPKNSTKESLRKKMQRNKNTRRSPTKNTTTNSTNNTANHEKPKSTNNSRVKPTQKKPQKPVKKQKVVKTPKAYVIEDSPSVKMENMGNDNFNQEEYLITKENYHQPNWKNQDEQQMGSMVEINQPNRHSDISESVDFDRNGEGPRQSWDRDINRPNRRASQFPCSGGDDESKVRSTKDIHGLNIARELKTNDCDRGIDADGKPITCHKQSDAISMGMSGGDETRVFNYPMEVAYSGDDDDDEYKGYERVLHNPRLSLDQINSTAFDNGPAAGGENSLTKRKIHGDETMENGEIMSINREAFRPEVKTSEFYELNEKRRNSMIDDQVTRRAAYSGNLEAIPRVGRQFVDFDNKNFEIRIQRSVDNHLMKGMTMKPRYQGDLHRGMYSQVDYGKIQEKIRKSQKGRVKKMKKPWKAYPRSLDKYVVVEKVH